MYMHIYVTETLIKLCINLIEFTILLFNFNSWKISKLKQSKNRYWIKFILNNNCDRNATCLKLLMLCSSTCIRKFNLPESSLKNYGTFRKTVSYKKYFSN